MESVLVVCSGMRPLRLGMGTGCSATAICSRCPLPREQSPSANESSCHGAQEMGLSPGSKAPATRSRRGGESFLSSPARSLTGLSSLPRRGFEGLQGPPTCAAGAGSGVCSGTRREERMGSSTGGSSALQEMGRGARMVTGSRGHRGTRARRDAPRLLVALTFPKHSESSWSTLGWRQGCCALLHEDFRGFWGLDSLLSAQDHAAGCFTPCCRDGVWFSWAAKCGEGSSPCSPLPCCSLNLPMPPNSSSSFWPSDASLTTG